MDILNKYPPKEKKKTGRRPKYKLEFMNMVASKVVDDGMKFREAAQTFGISQGSVAVWVKNYKAGKVPTNSKEPKVNTSTQIYKLEERVDELTREIGSLYLENQLLKKALSHAASKKKGSSSVITSSTLAQYQKDVK
jgi:transposase-like protein